MPEPARQLRYSRLRGMAVLAEDGRPLGRLADLILARRGRRAVVASLVVTRSAGSWLAPARGLSTRFEIEAGRLTGIDEQGIHVRDVRDPGRASR